MLRKYAAGVILCLSNAVFIAHVLFFLRLTKPAHSIIFCQNIETERNLLEFKMGIVGIILLVAFVVVCVFLVLLILVQDEGNNGMGGILGGRGTAAFGSHSAGVLTKATAVFAALFFAVAFILAVLNKKPKLEDDLTPTTTVEKMKKADPQSEKTLDKSGEDKKLWWQKTSSNSESAETENAENPDAEIKSTEEAENPASETAVTE